MSRRTIGITERDKMRLEELIGVAREFGGRTRDDLTDLVLELVEAKVYPSDKVPSDVVTMYSKVRLKDLDSGEEMTFVLAFPKDADVDRGVISVLAPIGTAILGYSKGDVVEWPVPSGKRRILIQEILYQPEAAGDFLR